MGNRNPLPFEIIFEYSIVGGPIAVRRYGKISYMLEHPSILNYSLEIAVKIFKCGQSAGNLKSSSGVNEVVLRRKEIYVVGNTNNIYWSSKR